MRTFLQRDLVARQGLHTTVHRSAGLGDMLAPSLQPRRGCFTGPCGQLDVCSLQFRQRTGAVLHSEKANVALRRRTGLTLSGLAGIPRICQGEGCLSVSWEPYGGHARKRAKVGSPWTLSNRATQRGGETPAKKQLEMTVRFLGAEEGVVNYELKQKCINPGLPNCPRGVLSNGGL